MGEVKRRQLQDGRNLRIERTERAYGQVVKVTVSARSGRILGVAEIQIPLSPGFTVAERVGEDEASSIDKAVEDLALRVAEAVQTEPREVNPL